IPNILTFMKPEALATLVPAVPPMSGGGENGIPTLKEITQAILNDTPAAQRGGGERESTAFMGILGFTIFAGLTLALVRGKHFPFAK
ncbi:MAG: hypothetical protein EBY32_16845, partial [Proteobacteria bacterium]|nr:hypothetical protein [Pseudomonadota bacterium]